MQFIFDHIVHYMEDPKAAIGMFKDEGIHAVEGGKHGNRPTYNMLSYFDLSYIEMIGTTDKKVLEQMDHPRHSMIETIINDGYKEGFVRFVVRTTNIEKAAEHFRSKGLTVNGPVPLSRKRPDGSLLEWQLLFIGSEEDELQLPYIIEWKESDEERRNELTESEIIVDHPISANFSHVSFAVTDLDKMIENWSDWLGLREIGTAFIDEHLQARCRTLELPGGNLVFCSPIGDGVVADILAERGEKPFQVSFRSTNNRLFELFGGRYQLEK